MRGFAPRSELPERQAARREGGAGEETLLGDGQLVDDYTEQDWPESQHPDARG